MEITISHILQLPEFDEVRVITGESGLDKGVGDISVLEMPIIETSQFVDFTANEFYLTSLYAYRKSEEKLTQLFNQLVTEKCSGVCIFDAYFTTLPQSIIDQCMLNELVVMFMPENIPYSSILKAVYHEVIRVKDEMYIESTLESIMASEGESSEVTRKAMLLNKDFYNSHMCIFINEIHENSAYVVQMIRNCDWFNKNMFVSGFRDGIILIASFRNLSVLNYQQFKEIIIHTVNKSLESFNVGISSQSNTISRLDMTLSEALVSNSACSNMKKQIVLYESLGVYKLLYRMKSDVRLSRFRDDILNPIRAYEEDNKVPLMETAVMFTENDGDIRLTAEALFLHENTVRYRIEKIKKILKLEHTKFKYYEELSLAIKADKILKRLH